MSLDVECGVDQTLLENFVDLVDTGCELTVALKAAGRIKR